MHILMISEEPNEEASQISHSDLYDIRKNSFSQFFSRVIFGNETNARRYFSSKLIAWRHANGSTIYGAGNDGKSYIQNTLQKTKYSLVITFGRPAAQIIFNDNLNDLICEKIVTIAEISRFKKVANKNFLCQINCQNFHTPLAILPHPSGQGQALWKARAAEISSLIESLQAIALSIAEKV